MFNSMALWKEISVLVIETWCTAMSSQKASAVFKCLTSINLEIFYVHQFSVLIF